jgi:hypothetical protein
MSSSCTAGPRKRTAKKASMTCTDQGLRSALAGSRSGGLTGTYSAFGALFRQLEPNLACVSAEKAEAEAGLLAETTPLAALNALARRAAQRVGSCPSCGQQITGHDLLATGQCGTCGRYGCATAGRVSWT